LFFEADPSLWYSEVVQEMTEIRAPCEVRIALVTLRYNEKYVFGME